MGDGFPVFNHHGRLMGRDALVGLRHVVVHLDIVEDVAQFSCLATGGHCDTRLIQSACVCWTGTYHYCERLGKNTEKERELI